MEATYTEQIAKEILEQIRSLDSSALMAWGSSDFIALPESEEFQGGLRFKVNGLTHRGTVEICLRWVDDYSVTFIDANGVKVHQCLGVYCDTLVDIIDWIEANS